MRGAPNWQKPGDVVDVYFKVDFLRWLSQLFGIRTLVETGTCHGSTILALERDFDEIQSVELYPEYFKAASERLKWWAHIHLYLGDSRNLLPGIMASIPDDPILFWLDAHPTNAETLGESPLAEELRLITQTRPTALIVIDDEPNAELAQVREAGVDLADWSLEYRTGLIVMHKGGYDIPPFEPYPEDWWKCEHCGFENDSIEAHCDECNAYRWDEDGRD